MLLPGVADAMVQPAQCVAVGAIRIEPLAPESAYRLFHAALEAVLAGKVRGYCGSGIFYEIPAASLLQVVADERR